MRRHELREREWLLIEPLLDGQYGQVGVSAKDNRQFINAVLWILKTGAPWRDLPERLGNWHTQYTRFRRWAKKGKWQIIFEALQVDPDDESWMVDSTIIRAHTSVSDDKKKGGRLRP